MLNWLILFFFFCDVLNLDFHNFIINKRLFIETLFFFHWNSTCPIHKTIFDTILSYNLLTGIPKNTLIWRNVNFIDFFFFFWLYLLCSIREFHLFHTCLLKMWLLFIVGVPKNYNFMHIEFINENLIVSINWLDKKLEWKKYKIVIKIDFVNIKVLLFDNGIKKKKKQFALLQPQRNEEEKKKKEKFFLWLLFGRWSLTTHRISQIMDNNVGVTLELENVAKRGQKNQAFGTHKMIYISLFCLRTLHNSTIIP